MQGASRGVQNHTITLRHPLSSMSQRLRETRASPLLHKMDNGASVAAVIKASALASLAKSRGAAAAARWVGLLCAHFEGKLACVFR